MSSYIVLARKYRPKQFSDIVGQSAVVKTIANAIRLKRTHHAYVFSGSRGIGKTSIARIFAKALRCPNVQERDGIIFSCDQCPDCLEIAAGNSINVLEIDGASNNGVDSVREIRENVRFLPTSGTYKIYIIDEVHMLSTAAFNALLKTLEEPPEHVVFIFATTEAHKIPETILGRCQRFDFQRVTVAQIIQRLKEILAIEKIPYEEASLFAIARSAEGSMRDALSILDQVISFSGMNVTLKSVRESLGLIGQERISELTKAILEHDVKTALNIAEASFDQGADLREILKALLETLHVMLLFKVGVEPKSTLTNDELAVLKGALHLRELEEIEVIFQMMHHGLDWVARSPQPKLLLDALIIKAATAEAIVKLGGGTDESSGTIKTQPPSIVAQGQKLQPQPAVQGPAPLTLENLINKIFSKLPVVAVLLETAVEVQLPTPQNAKIKVIFRADQKSAADKLQQKQLKDSFEDLLKEIFGFAVLVEISATAESGESMAEKIAREKQNAHNSRVQKIEQHPTIQEAKSLFGAGLTQIEFTDDAADESGGRAK